MHEEDREAARRLWRSILTGSEPTAVKLRVRRDDGEFSCMLVRAMPLGDEHGEVEERTGTVADVTERNRNAALEEALHRSEAQLAAELADTKLLQGISAQLIREEDVAALYEKILDAAVIIMRSDYASMQMLHPERGTGGELRLLAFRGFSPQAAKFWEWVRVDSESTCGASLRTGERVITPDVERCDFMAGTGALETFRQTGIRAVQTTPLLSRSGKILG